MLLLAGEGEGRGRGHGKGNCSMARVVRTTDVASHLKERAKGKLLYKVSTSSDINHPLPKSLLKHWFIQAFT